MLVTTHGSLRYSEQVQVQLNLLLSPQKEINLTSDKSQTSTAREL